MAVLASSPHRCPSSSRRTRAPKMLNPGDGRLNFHFDRPFFCVSFCRPMNPMIANRIDLAGVFCGPSAGRRFLVWTRAKQAIPFSPCSQERRTTLDEWEGRLSEASADREYFRVVNG